MEQCHHTHFCDSPDLHQKPSLHFFMTLIPLDQVYECEVLSSHPSIYFLIHVIVIWLCFEVMLMDGRVVETRIEFHLLLVLICQLYHQTSKYPSMSHLLRTHIANSAFLSFLICKQIWSNLLGKSPGGDWSIIFNLVSDLELNLKKSRLAKFSSFPSALSVLSSGPRWVSTWIPAPFRF